MSEYRIEFSHTCNGRRVKEIGFARSDRAVNAADNIRRGRPDLSGLRIDGVWIGTAHGWDVIDIDY